MIDFSGTQGVVTDVLLAGQWRRRPDGPFTAASRTTSVASPTNDTVRDDYAAGYASLIGTALW
jgi:hypothetical protein